MQTDFRQRLKGDLWVTVSAITTGGGLAIAKIALVEIEPMLFNCYLFFLGSLIILIDSAIKGKLRETIIISKSQIGFLFIIALFFALATLCLYTSLAISEPATVSFLSRLELIATIVLAVIFLKEKMGRNEIYGLIVVLAGILVMRYGASVELSRTLLLLTIASILIGTAEVLTKARINSINYRSYIFYRNIFISAIFLIITSALGKFVWIGGNPKLLGLIAICAFLLPYMGRLGYLKGMKYINISRASIISQSQPFFAAGVGLIFIGSLPPLKELIGGLLIVAGVVLIRVLEKNKAVVKE